MSEARENLGKLKGFDDFALSLGDELRGERATLGKSLLDVQRDLRIKAAYIAAIENCDPSVFPNQGFIAGYVRSYGRYLKLDPDEMFKRFCAESGFLGVNAGMSPAKSEKKSAPVALKGAEVSPRFPSYVTGQSESILNVISPSGIASAFVLTALIGGLGFGGWMLVNDIQRVEFAPIDQTPSTTASVDNLADVSEEALDVAGGSIVNSTIQSSELGDGVLGRLYRPQELAVPKLQPRDGPIASIDPDTVGVLKPKGIPTIIETVSEASQSVVAAMPTEPVVTIEASAPEIQLYATRAAWVRVHYDDGTVLFEKILEKGEYYTLPEDAKRPLLRAGNSGSVFVLVDDVPYGPVGSGTSVAKQVALSDIEIRENFATATNLTLAPEAESTVSTAESQ